MTSASVPTLPGIRPLREREFADFQAFIYKEAGIFLSKVKQALLVGRLSRRIRELGLDSFAAYYERVLDPRYPEERIELINSICTHETHFFREPRQFEYLEHVVLPRLRVEAEAGTRPKRIRAWSAGCSSGEEPFSIGMSLLAGCPASAGWTVDVVATDVSTRVLDRARAAVWSLDRSKHIPGDYLKRFMLRGQGEQQDKMKAGPELRDVVRFCRNVERRPALPRSARRRAHNLFPRRALTRAPCTHSETKNSWTAACSACWSSTTRRSSARR